MGTPKPPPPSVLWVGDRGEGEITDFDGRVRRGSVIGTLALWTDGQHQPTDPTYLRLRLDPPLTLAGTEHSTVVITERHQGTSLRRLGTTSISVYLFGDGPPDDVAQGVFRPRQEALLAWADVALDPAFLPETYEDGWNRVFQLLEQFVQREGHARVPKDHHEDGLTIGTWVQNMKLSQLTGRLRPEWASRLEELPGWYWFQKDEFALLDDYARREGHTDIPPDHDEDERDLGQWLAFIRSSRSHLPPDWIARLEAIPHWHW